MMRRSPLPTVRGASSEPSAHDAMSITDSTASSCSITKGLAAMTDTTASDPAVCVASSPPGVAPTEGIDGQREEGLSQPPSSPSLCVSPVGDWEARVREADGLCVLMYGVAERLGGAESVRLAVSVGLQDLNAVSEIDGEEVCRGTRLWDAATEMDRAELGTERLNEADGKD